MSKQDKNNLDIWLAILLLVATMATIILEIVFSNNDTTKLETSLFSVLQFVFSLAFSWLLARVSLQQEFQKSQKKFAISAYRRITEISIAVDRLLSRANSKMYKANEQTQHELDVICEISKGIRDSIRSSVADWADIIGDEISTIEKIKSFSTQELPDEIPGTQQEKFDEVETEKIIEQLLSSLPKSLRLTVEENSLQKTEHIQEARLRLEKEEHEKGYVELSGFYDMSFDKDIFDFSEDDILEVKVSSVGSRRKALIASDDEDNSVGVITNKLFKLDYQEFVKVISNYMGAQKFTIQLLSIDRKKTKRKRHYFTAKVVPPEYQE